MARGSPAPRTAAGQARPLDCSSSSTVEADQQGTGRAPVAAAHELVEAAGHRGRGGAVRVQAAAPAGRRERGDGHQRGNGASRPAYGSDHRCHLPLVHLLRLWHTRMRPAHAAGPGRDAAGAPGHPLG